MIADCPFCGNTEKATDKRGLRLIQTDEAIAGVLGPGWRVKCLTCEALGPLGDRRGALGQWNCWLEEVMRSIRLAKPSSEHPAKAIPSTENPSSKRPVTTDKKCGHGPEMLKVVDLYCAQCVKEAE